MKSNLAATEGATQDSVVQPNEDLRTLWRSDLLLKNVILPADICNKMALVTTVDMELFHSTLADAYGRKLSHSAQKAVELMLVYFAPRVQKGKTWHPASYSWLLNGESGLLKHWTEADLRQALRVLRRKGIIAIEKRQFSGVDPKTGVHRSRPAIYSVAPELIHTETRALGGATEVSIAWEYADGRVVHESMANLGDLAQWVVVDGQPKRLDHIVRTAIGESRQRSELDAETDAFFDALE